MPYRPTLSIVHLHTCCVLPAHTSSSASHKAACCSSSPGYLPCDGPIGRRKRGYVMQDTHDVTSFYGSSCANNGKGALSAHKRAPFAYKR
eukprot:4373637-Pyramimonas_sp.AAC.1